MKKFLIITLILTAMLQANAQKRAFTIPDLYKVQSVGALAMSPDGNALAYNVTRQSLKDHKSETDIALMDIKSIKTGQKQNTASVKMLTSDGKSSSPIWSRDGKSIFFTATIKKDKDNKDEVAKPQVYRLDLATGATTQITDYALGVSGAVLSPDNKLIAFVADIYPDLGGTNPEANLKRMKSKDEGPVQGHVADKLLFRHWTSYADGHYSHIIVFDIDKHTYTDVTPGAYDSPVFMLGGGIGFNFSPDSKELCFVSNRTEHPEANTNANLYTVPVTGGEPKCLTADNEAWDGSPIYSPDGKYIAYRMQRVPGHESDRFLLALYDRATGAKRVLTESVDNWVDDFKWADDSKSIYFTTEEQGYAPLNKVTLKDGKIAKVLPQKSLRDFALGTDGYTYYTYTTTGKPVALYRSRNGRAEQQLTYLNQQLEDEVDIRPSEAMWVTGADGIPVEVFIVKPHNFDPNKKYPLIVNVHGGPQSQWMDSFRGDWQVYPGAGYVVAYPNPHGSTGYGQAYTTSISGDWGGKPYEDVMKVTEALSKLPYIDADRMGAMGWSYGGFFMNWLQGQPHPFKCLASMMGLYDLRSMWGVTEELWFPNFDLKGQPWNSELYKKWSPSEYVKNFKTPALIITGERDYRVSYTQSLQYFTTLQTLGIPSRLIVFSNDGHWPDNLKSMPVYYNAHLEWFHKYLGGDPAPWDTEKMINNEVEY